MDDLKLVGGHSTLDFVNSEGGARNGPPERLGSYEDLLEWAQRAGVLEGEEAATLRRRAQGDPDAGADVLARALDLREALYRLVSSVTRGEAAADDDVSVLGAELAAALPHLRLVRDEGGFRLDFPEASWTPETILWILARDAAELLESEALERVKECPSSDCTWLFVDESRNRSRRWCDMGGCGNRAKVRRFRARRRS